MGGTFHEGHMWLPQPVTPKARCLVPNTRSGEGGSKGRGKLQFGDHAAVVGPWYT